MAELREFKCPACGGALEFDSGAQKMKCPYCDTEFEVEALKEYEEEVSADKGDEMNWESRGEEQWQEGESEGMQVYVCNSCGGEIMADENTAASSCPYCGNPVVVKGQFAGALRPDLIIPFKLDKKAARAAYLKHIKGKPLLPKVFKAENHIDEIKGVYVPFWLYDAKAHANVRYRATKVRNWSDKDYNYIETRYFSVKREGDLCFEKVPVDGSSRMADELMESIEPFDCKDAVDFQTAYLAGYLADKYDVGVKESEERANLRIKSSTEDAFRATVSGYASVVPESSSITLSGSAAKYAMYPVWILNTTWRGEKFTFAMNGQTGKIIGNLPVDKGAFRKWFLGVTAGVFAVSFAFLSALDAFAVPNIPAERQLPLLVDDAELLDYEDAVSLEERLNEISEQYRCDVAVVTVDTTEGADAQAFADDFYDYNGYGYGENDDGILFLLAMEEREWAMSTYGYGIEVFTDRKLDRISDEFLPYLKEGEYGEAFTVFAEMCGDFLDAAEYGEESEDMGVGASAGISLVLGLVAALIVTGIMRFQMRSVHQEHGAAAYVKPGSMNVTVSRDLFLYRHVSRTAKPKDNDTSTTHTSSSGRSHGGSSGSF